MSLRLVAVLVGAALLTACGSPAPGGQGGDPSPTSDAVPTGGAAFPVVVTRVGGFAGFNDRVTVAADGATTVSTRRGSGEDCRLRDDVLARLRQAVDELRAAPPSPTSARRVSDAMTTAVESPLTGGPLALPDAPAGAASVVVELLADVTGSPAAHTLCVRG